MIRFERHIVRINRLCTLAHIGVIARQPIVPPPEALLALPYASVTDEATSKGLTELGMLSGCIMLRENEHAEFRDSRRLEVRAWEAYNPLEENPRIY